MTRRSGLPKQLRKHAGLIALGVAGSLALAAAELTRVGVLSGPCTVQSGPVRLEELAEASGAAVSRRHPGVLWTHNDSGNDAVLFGVDAKDGTRRARIPLPIKTRDWEDVSTGRCANTDCLYAADIGDNRAVRADVKIYRFPEPGLQDAAVSSLETFSVRYPDGPHNAEGMFVIGTDIFIVTRDRVGMVYRGAVPTGGGNIALTRAGVLGISTVTDAETSTDGKSVIVRTSHEARLYRASDVVAGRFNPYDRIRLDELRERQGEGIAMDGATVYLTSENGAFGSTGALIALHCDFARP